MLLAFTDIPQRHQRLTIYPVVASDEPELSYLLVSEALGSGLLSISEERNGTVPLLVARNDSPQPILVLDCEEFQGARKARSTNRSLLLGPMSTTEFPVSCMEGSRWLRGDREMDLSETLTAFPALEGQVGVLAFLGQQFIGMDALGSPELYAPLHRRLLTGYLINALASRLNGEGESATSDAEILAVADALQRAERVPCPTSGHGEYSTLHGLVAGGELRHNGHLVHLSVFPAGLEA